MRVEMLLHSPVQLTAIIPFLQPRLWIDDEAFPRIRKLLKRAEHTVIIQMFIWKDDATGRSMAKLLLDLAERGVKVYLFKEAVGDLFESHQDFLTTKESTDSLWKQFWSHPNIRISYGHRNDHAKVYIIDHEVLLLTGMNIADEYAYEWHDYLVELRGRGFVEQYLTEGEISASVRGIKLLMNVGDRREIRGAVMSLIAEARESIVIEHCYLSDPQVITELIRRSHEGVRIVVIIPETPDVHHYSNMQAVSRLIDEGDKEKVSVFLYPRIVHGKIMLIDRNRAFIGSANLMTSSLDTMGELNVLIEGETLPIILKLRRVLREDILQSTAMKKPRPVGFFWRWLTWFQL